MQCPAFFFAGMSIRAAGKRLPDGSPRGARMSRRQRPESGKWLCMRIPVEKCKLYRIIAQNTQISGKNRILAKKPDLGPPRKMPQNTEKMRFPTPHLVPGKIVLKNKNICLTFKIPGAIVRVRSSRAVGSAAESTTDTVKKNKNQKKLLTKET